MPAEVRTAYDAELAAAAAAASAEAMWHALERAHILSQPWAWPHVVAHWQMLRLAWRQRDRREAIGQVVRLAVAAPGSLSGRYPTGNTGRASVGLRQTQPLPPDLAAILEDR